MARKAELHMRMEIVKHTVVPIKRRIFPSSVVASFAVLSVFWVVFSGKFDIFHLSLGAVSCAIVAFLSCDLLFPAGVDRRLAGLWLRFMGYIPYLLIQIFKANIHVLYLVCHPRMMQLINPHIIEFNTRLKSDLARTSFANSITLTPGTITVNATVMGKFLVHCIDTASGTELPGEMEGRIAAVFKE